MREGRTCIISPGCVFAIKAKNLDVCPPSRFLCVKYTVVLLHIYKAVQSVVLKKKKILHDGDKQIPAK